jgi:hypothetical protein
MFLKLVNHTMSLLLLNGGYSKPFKTGSTNLLPGQEKVGDIRHAYGSMKFSMGIVL